jgi:hypothetical protein
LHERPNRSDQVDVKRLLIAAFVHATDEQNRDSLLSDPSNKGGQGLIDSQRHVRIATSIAPADLPEAIARYP